MGNNERIGILSVSVPPALSGQAIILHRLLKEQPQDRLVILSSQITDGIVSTEKLNCTYYQLPILFGRKVYMIGKYIFPILYILILVEIYFRAYKIANVIRKEKLTRLIACTGSIHDLPAASIACRRTKIHLLTYVFDDYLLQWKGGYKAMAQIFEKQVLYKAFKIIVPNEFMAIEIEKRYSLKSHIIRNGVYVEAINPVCKLKSPLKFVFSGTVYYANYDSICEFVKELNKSDLSYCLDIYTSQPVADMNYKYHISSKNMVIKKHIPNKSMKQCYADYDIVLLPLSMNKKNYGLIKTSAPGKLGEYLNSGKPLLAIVPEGCFVDWYLRKFDCGFVVTDFTQIQSTISEIVNNQEKVISFINNAMIRSKSDFDIKKEREKFNKLVWT